MSMCSIRSPLTRADFTGCDVGAQSHQHLLDLMLVLTVRGGGAPGLFPEL